MFRWSTDHLCGFALVVRTAISIIPQEPQLFEGTMRENVDPTGVFADADIWESLRQAHLKDYVMSLPGGLDAPVREGGSSLSSGQRQLLCFARALLRNTKVIVLDEGSPCHYVTMLNTNGGLSHIRCGYGDGQSYSKNHSRTSVC